jgi:MFS family permease
MSGGLLAPMAQMMTARAAGKHMTRIIGYAAVPIMLGPILGPVIARTILQSASWRWLFLVNLPVGALAIILAIFFLPNDREETKQRDLDLVGFALLSPGLVLPLWIGSYGRAHRPGNFGSLCCPACDVLQGGNSQRGSSPGRPSIIQGQDLHHRYGHAIYVERSLVRGSDADPDLSDRRLWPSPSATGWLLAPLGVGMICSYPWMGALTQRFGIRKLSAGGAFLALAGTLPLVWLRISLMVSGDFTRW